MSIYYSNYPKATIRYDISYLSYVIISYTGNTTTTSNSIVSNNISTNYYITPELSFNTLYTFTITPYDNSGISGVISTFTMDTTPKISGVKATISNTANTTLQWKGITSYSYVKISRGEVIGISAEPIISTYTDISSVVLSSPYYDTDLSGNTTYSYKITPYTKGVAGFTSNDISIYKNVMSATDLSATFFDTSAIRISFTSTTNNYNTSQIFTLRAVNSTTGLYKDISGSNSPLLIKDLSDGTTYNCYILTTLDNLYTATSTSLSVSTINPNTEYIITGGTNYTNITTNSSFFSSLKFLYTNGANIYYYTPNKNVTVNILLVAGGGSGYGTNGSHLAGGPGGGGGGVAYGTISLKANTTYTITVGNGGTAGSNGSNTSISGSTGTTLLNETVYGGGRAAVYDYAGQNGGSGGGSEGRGGGTGTKGISSSYTGISSITYLGNNGANGVYYYGSGGGGGAGAAGGEPVEPIYLGGIGGIGYYHSYTNSYYGGGGCAGSPSGLSTYSIAPPGGGGNGRGSGGNNNNATPHTGGGGGGSYFNSGVPTGGTGGSGVVILMFN